MNAFNENMRLRSKDFALRVIKMCIALSKDDFSKILGKQLFRSATSVAANFRAACRARSAREFYHKMCIVVEEADESVFWIEMFEETGLTPTAKIANLKEEAYSLLKIFAKVKKNSKLAQLPIAKAKTNYPNYKKKY
jgi:four helix bundle protein